MKTTRHIATAFIALAAATAALVAKPIAGPKGGRILTTEAPHAEFFVAQDRTVVVTFYDQALKPLPLSGQSVSATAEAKSGRVKLDFAEKNGTFVSQTVLPESAEPYRVVVQLRDKAGATPKNFRVDLDLGTCGECKRAEYACTCEH